jgi:hypothetical protein
MLERAGGHVDRGAGGLRGVDGGLNRRGIVLRGRAGTVSCDGNHSIPLRLFALLGKIQDVLLFGVTFQIIAQGKRHGRPTILTCAVS